MSIETEKKTIPNYMKFVLGGTAGMMAISCLQPFDVVKTRMQISGIGSAKKEYKNALDCLLKTFKNEGIAGLYLGIGAALLRQATYTTTRLGVYTTLNDTYKSKYQTVPNILESMGMGIAAGAAGAFVGTPAEVALIRMQSDAKLLAKDRRNYKNVGNALVRIVKDEGLFALWRGCIPTVGRAVVLNMTQLASYSQIKQYIRNTFQFQEGIKLHLMSSMLSGLLTTTTSMPFDIAKTRIQNMKTINGKPEYRGTIDAFAKIIRHEGVFSLWKGFLPYYLKLGHLLFIFVEQLNKGYNKFILGNKADSSPL